MYGVEYRLPVPPRCPQLCVLASVVESGSTDTYTYLLSTIRTFTPALLSALAAMSPAGPAPMMRTSTVESGMFDRRVETWLEARGVYEKLRPPEL